MCIYAYGKQASIYRCTSAERRQDFVVQKDINRIPGIAFYPTAPSTLTK